MLLTWKPLQVASLSLCRWHVSRCALHRISSCSVRSYYKWSSCSVLPTSLRKTFIQDISTFDVCRSSSVQIRSWSSTTNPQPPPSSQPPLPEDEDSEKKLGLFKRFKLMYRNYWYVLVPVHCVTSVFWFGGFYYLAKSGIDIVSLLESFGLSEKYVSHLRDSSMGYIAVAYALYKIATPARYTVTLGGTTVSIRYLKEWGYIRPVPSRERLKEMYQEKRDELKERYQGKKGELKQKHSDTIDRFKDRMSSSKKNEE